MQEFVDGIWNYILSFIAVYCSHLGTFVVTSEQLKDVSVTIIHFAVEYI